MLLRMAGEFGPSPFKNAGNVPVVRKVSTKVRLSLVPGRTVEVHRAKRSTEPFPKQALVFTCLQSKSFENPVGKGEIARNEQFLLFPNRFLPPWRTFCHFGRI